MTDKPYPTGQVCVIVVDPTGKVLGEELEIASQETISADELRGASPESRAAVAGLLLQHVHHPAWTTIPPEWRSLVKGFYPIRWMVPKGVDPDPEALDVGVDVADDLEVTA